VRPTIPHPGTEPGRADVRAAVRAQVTLRFRVTADALGDRILRLAAVAGAPPAERPRQLERLVLDDLYLAMACADGEDEAWKEFDVRYFSFVRDFAARFVGSGRAEELAADIVADLWQRGKIAQFEGRSTLRTWLGAVVTHAALNVMAAGREQVPLTASDAARIYQRPTAASDVVDDAATLARLVKTALGRLDDEEKLLLLLHYEQELSLDEMAPLLGASKATLSRRLKRLRLAVRQSVEALAVAEGSSGETESLRRGLSRAWTEFDLSTLLAPRERKPL